MSETAANYERREIPPSELMVAWPPETDQIRVGPYLDTTECLKRLSKPTFPHVLHGISERDTPEEHQGKLTAPILFGNHYQATRVAIGRWPQRSDHLQLVDQRDEA